MQYHTYSEVSGKLIRIDFDRQVELIRVQVGNVIIAEQGTPWPEICELLNRDKVSRFTPNPPKRHVPIVPGLKIAVHIIGECEARALVDDQLILLQYVNLL